jgi:hypothetical protein
MKVIGLHMTDKEVHILYQDSINQFSGDLDKIIDKLDKIKSNSKEYENIKIELILRDKHSHSMIRVSGVKKSSNFISKLLKILSIS